MEQFDFGWDRVHGLNDQLVMMRMPAFGLSGPWRDRTGFAQTMECLTGMSWLTGFADGPPVLVRGACDPLAGMHAVIALLLALIERDHSGRGMLVEAAMVESVLNAAAEQVVEYGSSGTLLRRDGNRGPQAAPQGVYPCAGEDQWVALAVASDDQWQSLRSLLGDPTWAQSDDLSTPSAGAVRTNTSTVNCLRGPATARPTSPRRCFSTRAYRRPWWFRLVTSWPTRNSALAASSSWRNTR